MAPSGQTTNTDGALGLGIELRLGAVFLLFLVWLLATVAYIAIAHNANKWDGTDVFKVSATMAAGLLTLYGAWHTTRASARDRKLAMDRHDQLVELQSIAVARERRRRAFEILRALDEQDRVQLRVELRRQFGDIKHDLNAIKAQLQKDPNIESMLAKVLGSFEDMALAVRAHDVDESILFYSMGAVLVRYHRMFSLYIEEQREAHGKESNKWTPPPYCELEYVARAWIEGKSAQGGNDFPRQDSVRPWPKTN